MLSQRYWGGTRLSVIISEMSAPVLIAGQNVHFEAPRLQRSAYATEGISPRVVHVDKKPKSAVERTGILPLARGDTYTCGIARKCLSLQPLSSLSAGSRSECPAGRSKVACLTPDQGHLVAVVRADRPERPAVATNTSRLAQRELASSGSSHSCGATAEHPSAGATG